MRNATKRKIEPQHGPQQNKKHSTKPPSRSQANPKPHEEYLDEKRNLEDLWREVFLVGTEWDQLDSVYQYKWNFSNLENAFEDGGFLHGKRVYLFGCTEPQQACFKDVEKVIFVPIIVAVVSPFPPSDKIGITSVQRENEEIIPMKQMKMDWIPYMPSKDRLKSQIFILSCTQRRAALKHLKLEQVKKYEYCLPYFYHPFKEDELEQSTEVQILFPTEPKPEFTNAVIQDEELSADQKDAFKEFVKERVREAKKANKEAREARRKAIEEMSEETKAAFENIRFYKFYPVQSPDAPDVSKKCEVINRYYGKAHEYL
ncbi:protein HEAT INTOLERANT 4 isoform X2 [Arachis hypogaea]|uniref:protein HEAT INTOLERANT 4 isoform X2 n=1 Tax=Arachis hypogaea TaxID=3818 RepID=UPI000DECE125|nr:protein HEAT INTOLERANT 4 isoform X2 [Arachis hypogaea]